MLFVRFLEGDLKVNFAGHKVLFRVSSFEFIPSFDSVLILEYVGIHLCIT